MPSGELASVVAKEREEAFLELFCSPTQPRLEECCRLLGLPVNYYRRKDRRSVGFMSRLHTEIRRRKEGRPLGGVPDFLTFREKHFAYMSLREKDPRTGRKAIKRAVNSWFQVDAAEKFQEQARMAIVMPPGHIKTTMFAVEMSVHAIMADRNWRGLIVMRNQTEAAKTVASVQDRLQCEYYHHFSEMLEEQGDEPLDCPVCRYGGQEGFKPIGRSTGDVWGAMQFRVTGRTSGERDHTFQALGYGSQIQGIRADRIILDDIQDPVTAKVSEIDSMQKMEWFHDVILGRVNDVQQVGVLGNFFSPDDFMHKLIDSPEAEDFHVTKYPAVLDYDKKQILCPEFWTFDALMRKRKEVGENTWHFTWEQSEGSYEDQVFRREVMEKALTDDLRLGMIHPNVTHVYIGVDPAIVNYCAMVVWGLDQRTGTRYVIDLFNKKGMRTYIPNIADAVIDLTARYSPRAAVIESVSQQKSLHDNPTFRKDMRNLGCSIVDYLTHSPTGGKSEAASFDISSVGGLYDEGLIVLPYGGTVEERQRMDDYITQHVNWRPGVKSIRRDLVMATLFAESEAFIVAQRRYDKKVRRRRDLPDWVATKAGDFAWMDSKEPTPLHIGDETREERLLRRRRERLVSQDRR